MGLIKGFLDILAATADIERFGEWKGKLEDALGELEKRYKGEKLTKEEYEEERADLEEQLKAVKTSINKHGLQEKLKKLEDEFRGEAKKMAKKEYEERKAELNKRLKKAEELLEKSRERLEKATAKEIKL